MSSESVMPQAYTIRVYDGRIRGKIQTEILPKYASA
jgi:hypothetical protein